jgi:hypothetical protein
MIFLLVIFTIWIVLNLFAIGLCLATRLGDLRHAEPYCSGGDRPAHSRAAGHR